MNEENVIPQSLTEEEVDRIVAESLGGEEIPSNSDTLLINERASRFSSAAWFEEIQKKIVVLAGLGGIGSITGILLAKLNPASIFLYDDDIVEPGNMSGQFYGNIDLNIRKTTALSDAMKNYANYNSIFAINEKFDKSCEAADIMICGFDNMKSRKIFFKAWYEHVLHKPSKTRKDCLFIDGRLSAEKFQVFCIRGDDTYNIDNYKRKWLFSDEEAEETVCSYKQTAFCANMIGSVIVNLFVNFCANNIEGENALVIPRELPFFTAYDAETMFFKTES